MRITSVLLLTAALFATLEAAPTSPLVELEVRGLRKGLHDLFHRKGKKQHDQQLKPTAPQFLPPVAIHDSSEIQEEAAFIPLDGSSSSSSSGNSSPVVLRPPSSHEIKASGYKLSTVYSPPKRYEKYYLLGRLGSGAFGDVELGWRNGAYYALKFIRPEKFDPIAFDHEAAMQYMLKGNKYAVQLVGTINDNATKKRGMIMEAANAGDLRHYVDDRPKGLDEVEAKYFFSRLALGLYYAHKHNVAIRDIKPDNILLMRSQEGKITPKFADFGLSAKLSEPHGGWAGSPPYLPSEAFARNGYDWAKGDVFALGVTLYYMLTPFEAEIPREHTNRDGHRYVGPFNFNSSDFLALEKKYPRAASLIRHMVDPNPTTRYTPIQVLKHDWPAIPQNVLGKLN